MRRDAAAACGTAHRIVSMLLGSILDSGEMGGSHCPMLAGHLQAALCESLALLQPYQVWLCQRLVTRPSDDYDA